jgi:methylated-DNA-[protein]-cysteine S-methyltransferase
MVSEFREHPAAPNATLRLSPMKPLVFRLERVPAPCGDMLVATDEQGSMRALEWDGFEGRLHRYLRLRYGGDAVRIEPAAGITGVRRSLEAYLDGDLHAIDRIPVRADGTPFQRQVWAALRAIPAGTTVSYGTLAARIGRPSATRAVGMANNANPTGVVVPCHRVIGADGSLTGYGGGLARKRWLLEHEGVRLRGD